jgi:hypothetical protein
VPRDHPELLVSLSANYEIIGKDVHQEHFSRVDKHDIIVTLYLIHSQGFLSTWMHERYTWVTCMSASRIILTLHIRISLYRQILVRFYIE